MNKLLTSTLLVLFGGAGLSAPWSRATAAPIPGPGGVAVAVRDFLQCLDEGGDPAGLLADEKYAVDMVVRADGGLGQAAEGTRVAVFFDVAADGTPLSATTAADFAAQAASKVAASERAARALRTEIGTIRAACDSERCSWSVVDFERVYTMAGAEVRVPMRASALLRYVGSEAPNFRIYQWHASRRADADANKVGR
ncbi:MAG: hypothetical protein KDC98_21925 [Planctomycetes bacterium]|nr:hypothetical protein [Planctomycetota bacterium]